MAKQLIDKVGPYHEKHMVGGVDLAWELSEMDNSGYAYRLTLIEGEGLTCMPVELDGHRGYKAMIGSQDVSDTVHDMPDGAMFEAEEVFKARHPILSVMDLESLLHPTCRLDGFNICGFIPTGSVITFSAWGKEMLGALYKTIKESVGHLPVVIKIDTMWLNPATRTVWYTVRITWVW